jgi:uncharacterized phage-like protein YoqJ
MKEKICCFTGHREIDESLLPYLNEVLRPLLVKLIEGGVTTFRAGGARGFDNLAAMNVLIMKQKYPDVRLHLCLPCPDQADKWHSEDKYIYRQVVEACDSYTYAEPAYTRGCMHKRNRQLVDGADFCIAYYDGSSGGTAYTVDYASSHGVSVINIYPLLIEASKTKKRFFRFR